MLGTDSISQKRLQPVWRIVVWVAVGLVFAPSLIGLAGIAGARDQLRDAAMVLIFALIFLIRERPEAAQLALRFSPKATIFLGASCLASAASGILGKPLLLVAGLGLLAGAVLLFLFGDELIGPATGLAVAFSGFVMLAVVFPLADLPLRIFAGKASAALLDFFGAQATLGFSGEPAKLILISNGRPFEVAPECNGFGITSSCILLGLLLAFSRRLRILDKVLIVALAPLLGLFSNALRILGIVLLAPMMGAEGYHLMHEAVGITLFLGTLAFVWWLVSGLPEKDRGQRKSPIS